MRITRAVIPNFFTVMNLFCGFNAIIQAHAGNYGNAAWFIIFGGFFDAFDGFMARLTNSASQFGVELDSLSDVVTFGVAPSFLVYQLGLDSMGFWGILISAMPAICGALRLARFNVQLTGFDKDYFRGLPIPGQAVVICSLVLTVMNHPDWIPLDLTVVLPVLVIFLSLLMVSTVKYDTIPKLSPKAIREKPLAFASLVTFLLLVLIFRERGLLVGMTAYLLIGLIRYPFKFIKKPIA